MAKRKRGEQAELKTVHRDGQTQKTKVQEVAVKEQKAVRTTIPKQKSAVVPVSVPEASKPTVVRMVIGSYEKVLAGIEARFTSELAGNVYPINYHLTCRTKCY